MGQVDAVTSGLPFALIPGDVQRNIIDEVARTMRPEGAVFITFNCVGAFNTPPARRIRTLLRERFHELVVRPPRAAQHPTRLRPDRAPGPLSLIIRSGENVPRQDFGALIRTRVDIIGSRNRLRHGDSESCS